MGVKKNMLKRFHTVFIKLILSYAMVIIFLSFSIGAVSYGFFSGILENEIATSNKELVYRTAESLQHQIFEQAERIWTETVMTNEQVSVFFEAPDIMRAVDHYNIWLELQKLCRRNSNWLYAMDIYVKDTNTVISSLEGIKYLQENELGPAEEFADILEKGAVVSKWIAPKDIPIMGNNNPDSVGEKYITFIRTIPYIQSENIPLKGYLAIKVKEKAVSELLRSSIRNEDCEMMVIDRQGTLISHSDSERLMTDISGETYIENLLGNAEPFCSIDLEINGDRTMITAVTLELNGLTLVRKLSYAKFYQELKPLKWIIALICLVLGTAGFGVSILFAREIYNPLQNIVKNLTHFMDAQDERTEINEYRLINNTLKKFSSKVNHLEKTLAENMPIIRSKIIEELLTLPEQNRRTLQSRLKICNICFDGNAFAAFVVMIRSKVTETMEVSSLEYFRLDLMRYSQSLRKEDEQLYASAIRDTNIGVIYNSKTADNERLKTLIRQIMDYAWKQYRVDLVVGLGDWTSEITNVNLSYAHALQCIDYAFLFPEKHVLSVEQLQERERSDEMISLPSFKKYHAAVRSGNLNEVTLATQKLVDQLREQPYSFHICRRVMNEMVSFLNGYLLEKKIDAKDVFAQSLYTEQEQQDNIFDFKDWLIERIAVLLDYLNQNKGKQPPALVGEAVKYIETHLDQDLSLSVVAEKVYIAAPYFSTLFKENMGVNFNAYVTQKRLEYARELILNTNDSVNVITKKVGFNSSTYLIKKFKEVFGDTPVNYKKNMLLNGGQAEREENKKDKAK